MIQRIQTVFLFLAIIALVVFNILPYWQGASADGLTVVELMSYGLVVATAEPATIQFGLYTIVAAISGIVLVLLLVEILSYKSRVKQLKIAIANSFLLSIGIVLMTWFIINLQEDYQGGFGLGIFIFAMAMLLNILARRFIQKDEKLVRSVDRLR